MTLFTYQLTSIQQLTSTHWQVYAIPTNEVMCYQAGQYLHILYPNQILMPFSIANAPKQNNEIELHIRATKNDVETRTMLDKLQATKIIRLAGPYGNCRLITGKAPLILVAAGTGLAPAKAIIEDIINIYPNQELHLYWLVKNSNDFYLPTLPAQWQKQLANFSFVPICTQDKNQQKNSLFELISGDIPQLATCLAYVFGPPNLAKDCLREFVLRGLEKIHFYTDVL